MVVVECFAMFVDAGTFRYLATNLEVNRRSGEGNARIAQEQSVSVASMLYVGVQASSS